jgi:hypothetical protein
VFAYVPPDQLGTVLTAHGSAPKLSADTRALIRGLDKSLNWLLVLGGGHIEKWIGQVRPRLGVLGAPPELETVLQQAQAARALSYNADLLADGAERITVRVTCGGEPGAAQLTAALKKLWTGKTVQDFLSKTKDTMARQGQRSSKGMIDEINASITFTTVGVTSQVSLEVSRETIDLQHKEQENLHQPGDRRIPNIFGL